MKNFIPRLKKYGAGAFKGSCFLGGNNMYIHHIRESETSFRHIYNLERLTDIDKWCRRDIERLEEAIQQIKNYQMELYNHVQEVLQTDIKKIVTLVRRENWSTKRVEFYVTLEHRPQVDKTHVNGEKIYGNYTDQKNFKGTERHSAIKYANDLSKKYHCSIERTGF